MMGSNKGSRERRPPKVMKIDNEFCFGFVFAFALAAQSSLPTHPILAVAQAAAPIIKGANYIRARYAQCARR
jgi:hypothetical protein